ncbi:MAG: thiamine pyrophosphate-binding protein [Gammaproteobacteria bacterium]
MNNNDKRLSTSWPDRLFDVIERAGVKQVAYVPDAGHAQLIERCRAARGLRTVPLTTEEEGVALLVGAWLGGQRGVLLMQSSGVGNCINMLAMVAECRFPLLMLVTMRGDWGESNPWQLPMGQSTATALGTAGVVVSYVDDPARLADDTAAGARIAFDSARAVAVLISQRIIGSKAFK